MRAIHSAQLDRVRPVLILTREAVRPYVDRVTVAPIFSQARGIATEVQVGPVNGLDHGSVANCDNITTIPTAALRKHLGYLLDAQEPALAEAILAAFDLEEPQ